MICLKQRFIFCFLFFILCGIQLPLHAGFSSRHYQSMQGLSYNAVMCLFQDQKGFIWIGTKNGLNRFDGNDFKVYLRTRNNNGLPNSIINGLTETADGNLWIATDKGLAIYYPERDSFKTFSKSTKNGEQIHGYVRSADVDSQGNVWIVNERGSYIYERKGTLQNIKERIKVFQGANASLVSIGSRDAVYLSYDYKGIILYDLKRRQYEQIAKINFPVSDIVEYDDNNILVGSPNGLYKVNRLNGHTAKIALGEYKGDNVYVRAIEKTDGGTFWIGTESGVYIYTDKVIQHLSHSLYNSSYLSDNAIYDIMKDKDGGMWIGSYFGGVDYLPKQNTALLSCSPEQNRNSVGGSRIRAFAYDSDNNLWIGTEDNGLDMRSAANGEFKHIKTLGGTNISGINIQCLRYIKDQLWIGTFNKGIYVYDRKSDKTAHYHTNGKPGALPNNDVFAIYGDKDNNIWIGTSSGFYQFSHKNKTFIVKGKFNGFFVSDIAEDRHGNLWIATYNNGAVRYNHHKEELKLFRYAPNDSTSLCYDRITYIFRDSKSRLWLASEDGGMCLYKDKSETFERFDTSNGLPSNSIYCIQEDDSHQLWLSTNNGLASFNPETKTINALFGVGNGLPTKQFNYNAGIKSPEGKIIFGGILGYVELIPETLYAHSKTKPIILTGLSVFNRDIKAEEKGILSKNIYYAESIKLKYNQNTFTIKFSTLDYANECKGIYAYKLEGFDKQWNIVTDANSVSYHNIPAGHYTFRIKHMSNRNDKTGKETTIRIIITPPFWQSWLAYFIYMLLFCSGTYLLWKKISNERKQKRMQLVKQQKIEQEEHIYQEKINFFISIAHEIRTPVSLIKAPLEYLTANNPTKKEIDENLTIIARNTERLQNLINQLLDFKKVESESFRLQMKPVNVFELLKSVICRFEPTALQQGIKIDTLCENDVIIAKIDEEAVVKIISNLLTNAIKYGETYISVKLSVNDDRQTVVLSVSNDGELIPAEMREKIFEAFVQIDRKSHIAKGTGLGLALTKSLVELHSGTIRIDDAANDNCFVVELPINMSGSEEPLPVPLVTEEADKHRNIVISSEKKQQLLIAEDDYELRAYLKQSLGKKYNVMEADNGRKALQMVKDNDISLIISDIVMPEMTGLELCSHIKSEIDTCDIPVILLTAKATLTDKIEGLEKGADAYIEKPFSMNHLITQIDSLIDNRRKMIKNFASNPLHAYSNISDDDADKDFAETITRIINDNMHREEFNVDSLAEAVNMSRSSLHRKIKEVTGRTPNELIKVLRMNKAAELIAGGGLLINEVCLKVGIQSFSHFSRTFAKQFGVLPKDFAQSKTPKKQVNSNKKQEQSDGK